MTTLAPPAAPFPHLHVASGYSLRYGTSTPSALVARAADLGMPVLALTDRDGLYGAVKFVRACGEAGLAPVLGVDLATTPTGLADGLPAWADPSVAVRRTASRAPVRGGAAVDPRLPRVTVLALGADDAGAGRGWAALCRLVSATHLGGERGTPVSSLDLVAAHAGGSDGRLHWRSCSGRGPSSAGHCWPAGRTSPTRSCAGGARCCRPARCTSRWSATTPRRARPAASSTPPGCSPSPAPQGFRPS